MQGENVEFKGLLLSQLLVADVVGLEQILLLLLPEVGGNQLPSQVLLQQETILYFVVEAGGVDLEGLQQFVHVLLNVLLLHLLLCLERGASSLAALDHCEEEAVARRFKFHRYFWDVWIPLLRVQLRVDLFGLGYCK